MKKVDGSCATGLHLGSRGKLAPKQKHVPTAEAVLEREINGQ